MAGDSLRSGQYETAAISLNPNSKAGIKHIAALGSTVETDA